MRFAAQCVKEGRGRDHASGIFPAIRPLADGRFHPLKLISTAAKGRSRALTLWRDGPILQHTRLDFLASSL
jgi:hypothetical protein